MSVYAFDTETHLIQPGLGAPPLVCGSVAGPGGSLLLARTGTLAWVREHIQTSRIVGCNLAYDLGVMCAADPSLVELVFAAADEDRLHDIAIREALIDIARGDLVETGDPDEDQGARYPLSLLVQRHLGKDITAEKHGPDAWRYRYARLDGVPLEQWPEAARAYPISDAENTLAVFEAQERVPGRPNLHDEPAEVRAALALRLASIWGFRTDKASVADLRARVDSEWERSRAEFAAHGIFRSDGSKDTKRLAQLVIEAYGGAPPYTHPSAKFPNGQVATDRDTLLESGNPVLEKLGRSGKNDKYRSTYLPKLEAAVEVPYNPSFNILVATTRVSSDTQQLPKKGGVRECIRARDGFVFCSVDYEGLELRTMSQRAIDVLGWSRMAEALLKDLDPHAMAAASFLGTTYKDILARRKAKDPIAEAFRDLGKIFNFGKGGGMGAGAMAYNARAKDDVRFCLTTKLAEKCGVEKRPVWVQGKQKAVCAACIEVSKRLGYKWLDAWPEQKQLFAMAGRLTDGEKLVEVEIPRTGIRRGKCGYTQWLNTPFQGLGAVGAKRATWLLSREMYCRRAGPGGRMSPLYGSRLVLMVHDENIAELPEDRAHEAGERMALIMREALKPFVPDLAPAVKADPALSRIMAKSAKTLRGPDGRLQVWEPEAKRAA